MSVETSSRLSLLSGDTFTNIMKRTIDILGALFGLFLLSPFFLLVAILIKRTDPGPIFYRGRRVGKHGRVFDILKFRTMYENPASYQGPKITAKGDARITPIGRWLRDTKLNELPQFLNVLKGEMSLVGPRPEDPDIVATWSEDVRREILSVRPGITSPASVLYRDEEKLLGHDHVMKTYLDDILPTKMRLDQLYVRRRSFWIDLDVILWTLLVVLVKSFSPAEELLFRGPIAHLVQRYISWFTIDLIITFLCIGVTGLIWRSARPLDVGLPLALIVAFGFAFLFSLVSALLGMDRIAWRYATVTEAWGVVFSAGLAMVFALILNQIIDQPRLLPPEMIIAASVLSLFGFLIARYRSRLFSGSGMQWLSSRAGIRVARERALIVGSGDAGQFMAWLLNNSDQGNSFEIIGFVDDDLYKQGIRFQGITVVGGRADLPDLVTRYDVGVVFFAIHNISDEERSQVLSICNGTQARVVLVPNILGYLDQEIPFEKEQGQAETFSKEQFSKWLDEIDLGVQSGDADKVRAQIRAMQQRLDVSKD